MQPANGSPSTAAPPTVSAAPGSASRHTPATEEGAPSEGRRPRSTEFASAGFTLLLLAVFSANAFFGSHLLISERDESLHSTAAAVAAAVAGEVAPLLTSGRLDESSFRLACDAFGQRWPLVSIVLRPSNGGVWHWLSPQPPDGPTARVSRSLIGDDGRTHGDVEVRLAGLSVLRHEQELVGWSTVAALITLAGFAACYRALRRRYAPLDAIRDGLESYARGLERDLRMLTLNDRLDRASETWNRFIGELSELRRRGATNVAATDVLSTYELRGLRETLDETPCGVLRVDDGGLVQFCNATAGELLAQPTASLVGTRFAELLGDDAPQDWLTSAASGRRPIERTLGDGAQRRFLRFELRRAASGEPLVFVHDVGHLKEAERTRDNFLYHVTHELRTPLTNIAAYVETLTRPDFDDEETRRECYNVLVSETKRLSDLVEDILSVSQMEVGSVQMDWSAVDLQRLARKVVQDNLGGADAKQIELSLELPPKPPVVRGDKHRLAVLLNNLVGNAIKYTPESGRVAVRIESAGELVRIRVQDTGIGIPKQDQTHVFEKFYRVACEEVQAVKGTGLGLAICREVVALHSGEIRLESEPGKGTTFIVDLPAGADAAVGGTRE